MTNLTHLPQGHEASVFAGIAIVAKLLGHALGDEHVVGLLANWIAITSGLVSLAWVIHKWRKDK